jgi:ATP-dependent Clp protease ATP-binding subunit ClpA
MQNNPEIEQLIETASKLSRSYKHEYVLTEHLLLALLRHAPFATVLTSFGTNVDMFDLELDAYLASLPALPTPPKDYQPKKTHGLERVFNRALTQVLFTEVLCELHLMNFVQQNYQ